jgi:hypothetical protein
MRQDRDLWRACAEPVEIEEIAVLELKPFTLESQPGAPAEKSREDSLHVAVPEHKRRVESGREIRHNSFESVGILRSFAPAPRHENGRLGETLSFLPLLNAAL